VLNACATGGADIAFDIVSYPEMSVHGPETVFCDRSCLVGIYL
jgi:hypothetical protein